MEWLKGLFNGDNHRKKLNERLTREIWCNTYALFLQEGNDAKYCRQMADASVSAYNDKFIKVKIKLN